MQFTCTKVIQFQFLKLYPISDEKGTKLYWGSICLNEAMYTVNFDLYLQQKYFQKNHIHFDCTLKHLDISWNFFFNEVLRFKRLYFQFWDFFICVLSELLLVSHSTTIHAQLIRNGLAIKLKLNNIFLAEKKTLEKLDMSSKVFFIL